jgi:8-oxo-dGTP diphosphatase
VISGGIATLDLVPEALEHFRTSRLQRVAAYGLAVRDGRVLLTRIASKAVWGGQWTLPGGGVDFGEEPRAALVREFHEETGLVPVIDRPLEIHDVALTGMAPSGRWEEFHGIHLVFQIGRASCRERVS